MRISTVLSQAAIALEAGEYSFSCNAISHVAEQEKHRCPARRYYIELMCDTLIEDDFLYQFLSGDSDPDELRLLCLLMATEVAKSEGR